jgi:valyl-tRNA synthetase
MPFITEELWHNIEERKEGESLMMQQQPKANVYSEEFIKMFEEAKSAIVTIRSIRQSKNISPKEPLALFIKGDNELSMSSIYKKIANISEVSDYSAKSEEMSGSSFMVGTTEFFVPLGNLVNKEEEIAKIEAELKHLEGFLTSVMKKLSNEKFVCSAPKAVVDMENKKKSDAETKIAKLNQLKEDLLK